MTKIYYCVDCGRDTDQLKLNGHAQNCTFRESKRFPMREASTPVPLIEVIEDHATPGGHFAIGRAPDDARLWLTWQNGEAGGWIAIDSIEPKECQGRRTWAAALDAIRPPLSKELKRLIAY
jgi:hypothetical protein